VLTDFSVSYSPAGIYSDVRKSCIAVFLAEILSAVLKEAGPGFEVFDYIENSIKYLDRCDSGYANFHIAFLIGLCSFLGFEPGKRVNRGEKYFDLLNGAFVRLPPHHSDYTEPYLSEILSEFFDSSFDQMRTIPLTGALRNEVLDTIIRYFRIHLQGLNKIKSFDILKEIFK
jgi:DNA repair protein RecO (recombination protein O)